MRAVTAGVLMITALAAGCASGPAIRTSASGAPPAATSFGLAGDTDQAAAAAVGTELHKRGWRISERNASWQVDVARTRRNEGAGAFTAELRPETQDAWTLQPTPSRWWRRESDERRLALALVDVATGERVAQGQAWTRRRPDQVSDDRLAAAAVEALLNPAAAALQEAQ